MVEALRAAVELDADFLIVGSGAAGATMARWLAAAGRSVLVFEEGPRPTPAEGALDALSRLYRDAGATAAIGADVLPLLQGRCVGGTTVVNGAIQVPFPEPVWREWVAGDPRWAERLPWRRLLEARDRMEHELHVVETPPELRGGNGGALLAGLGDLAHPTRRNVRGCAGLGRCLEACPHGHKESVDRSLLPRAERDGATVFSEARVRRLLLAGGRAVGVAGTMGGRSFRARARRGVVLAAGAIQSAALAARAGVPRAGRNFSCHPGAAMAGWFGRPVFGAPEATQSAESLAYLERGVKLESLGMPRAFRAARVPGVGRRLRERLERLDEVALWGAAVRAEARGRVASTPLGPLVLFTPSRADRARLLFGLSRLAAGMLAAGAREIWPAVHGAPEVIHTRAEAEALAELPPEAGAIPMVATHLFGGLEVDDRFQAGGVPGLIAADSALFPSNLGVNPMSAICAVATLVAERWAELQ